jgi:hypothetical protein
MLKGYIVFDAAAAPHGLTVRLELPAYPTKE